MTATAKMFKDVSMFQGIKEFLTPAGMVRSVEEGLTWGVYLQQNDGSFMRVGTLSKNNNKSPRSIYNSSVTADLFN